MKRWLLGDDSWWQLLVTGLAIVYVIAYNLTGQVTLGIKL